MKKSVLPVSKSTAHYVVSFDGCATQNSDRPQKLLGGVPTKILPDHIALESRFMRGTIPALRFSNCLCFGARGWALPVLCLKAANPR